ncbi:hypothetical protein [Brevundimonas albigilva]|nr:hypothetical protein [Brevundimonas albigilva]
MLVDFVKTATDQELADLVATVEVGGMAYWILWEEIDYRKTNA